ncbi:MAG: hypothetical protein OEQ39_01210 [Gammaproteobacteria bacterium]|nr:hypothetical protein [Gammaproteobacteria bacterium]MDH3464539.1 hypothetical protein [Gammaproteobacteria bacterium]
MKPTRTPLALALLVALGLSGPAVADEVPTDVDDPEIVMDVDDPEIIGGDMDGTDGLDGAAMDGDMDITELPELDTSVAQDADGVVYPQGGPSGLYVAIADKQAKTESSPSNFGLSNALDKLRRNLERALTKLGIGDDGVADTMDDTDEPHDTLDEDGETTENDGRVELAAAEEDDGRGEIDGDEMNGRDGTDGTGETDSMDGTDETGEAGDGEVVGDAEREQLIDTLTRSNQDDTEDLEMQIAALDEQIAGLDPLLDADEIAMLELDKADLQMQIDATGIVDPALVETVNALSDEQVGAMNKSFHNVNANGFADYMEVGADELQQVIDAGLTEKEIKPWTKAYEEQAKFTQLALMFEARGDADKAELLGQKGEMQKEKFLNKAGIDPLQEPIAADDDGIGGTDGRTDGTDGGDGTDGTDGTDGMEDGTVDDTGETVVVANAADTQDVALEKTAKADVATTKRSVDVRSDRIDRKSDRAERIDRKPERVERVERIERVERVERPDKPARAERVERPSKPERITRVERPSRPDKPSKPDRPSKPEKPQKPDRPTKS